MQMHEGLASFLDDEIQECTAVPATFLLLLGFSHWGVLADQIVGLKVVILCKGVSLMKHAMAFLQIPAIS